MASVLSFYLMLIISKYLEPLLNVTCNVLAQMPSWIYPGTTPASASVLSVPGNSSSPRSHYHHLSVGVMVFPPLPCAAWEVLLTMPVVHTPTSYSPL